MKSKNIYQIPLAEEQIEYVIKDSPAHKIYKEKDTERIDNLTNAIDFLCKKGTPINASLEGKVIAVFNEVTKNWNKEIGPPTKYLKLEEQDGNYIVIEHVNGELSIYSHMQKDSITVRKGVSVKTGQKIGLSGNTGWSIKPHVHMMVHYFPEKNNGGFESLIPKFDKKSQRIINKKLISHKEFQKLKKAGKR